MSIWGYADYNRLFYIDKDGYIQQENIGRVYLKGLTLEQAKGLLYRFSNAYMIDKSDFDVHQLLSCNYYKCSGRRGKPRFLYIPAINTALQYLGVCGRSSKLVPIRDIQIKETEKLSELFDLYKFLLLQKNKTIFS